MSDIFIQAQLKREGFTLDINLSLPGRGVTAILGPSGSGKTTLLRLLAGLEKPQQGLIRNAGETWLDSNKQVFMPPQKRKVGVVFQDYALFEHMTVENNVGFGLPRTERRQRVPEWLEKLNIKELAQRYPNQLSGGQRQRVALARALITEPELLLLDEPFSALDTHLKKKLREQLLEVVGHLQQPVLLVTHDLNEARYLADNIGVMINGIVQRIDKSSNVFNDPRTLEVARVTGWHNFLPVTSIEACKVSSAWGEVGLEHEPSVDTDWLAIRPEHIRINTQQANIDANVVRVTELDGFREMVCELKDGTCLYLQAPWNELLPVSGSQLKLELPEQHIKTLQEGGDTKIYTTPVIQRIKDNPEIVTEQPCTLITHNRNIA